MRCDLLVAGNLAEDLIFGTSYYGGSAGLIALNASLLGLRTGVISNCGKDDFSQRYLRYLTKRGVQTELINPSLKRIAQCIVSSSENHSTSKKWIDNGTSNALRELMLSEEQRGIIAKAQYVHLTTTPGKLALAISGIVPASGFIGYEPGPRVGDDEDYFNMSVFQRSDALFVNEEELAIIDDKMGVLYLQKILNQKQVIIATKGEMGVEVIRKNERLMVRTNPVQNTDIIDSNGAGDAFKSGFYFGLAKTGKIEIAIEYGNLLGGLIVKRKGALLEYSDMATLRGYLDGRVTVR